MVQKVPLSKNRLEQLCVLYLRQFPRSGRVETVRIRRPACGPENWVAEKIIPNLSVAGNHVARLAIRELQDSFRMVT